MSTMRALRSALALAALLLGYGRERARADVTFVDTNPNQSDTDNADPDGASGGRTNGLASVPGDNDTFYAATEWGGIYQSTDAGLTWDILPGHRPMVTWDVEVDPGNTARVIATSFFDGRTSTLSGINVSTDSGATWTRPATATPPAGYNCAANAIAEPAAFGISFRPDASANIVVGTNCGVALSTDSGVTWTFVDPTPLTTASRIWDAVYHSGGTIDVCGDDGHFRSVDGGATWTGGAFGLPTGRCSIAVSPDESYVLLVAAANNNIYESDDAGATWTNLGTPDFSRQGRIPFVETNQRSDDMAGNRFDLWYGDVSLYRGACRTPATPAMGGATRCPAAVTGNIPSPYVLPANWAGSFTRCRDADGNGCAHDDVGTIVFDSEAANDACPAIFSSDGGVYRNTDTGADCQDPNWEQPNITPHATWLFGMEGVNRAGAEAEDLYFGMQDNGIFGTMNASDAAPAWHNEACCDGFSQSAEAARVLYVRGAFGARAFRLFTAAAGLTGETEINTYPADGLVTTFNFDESVARFGNQQFVVLMLDCVQPGSAADGVDNDGDMNVDEANEGNGCSNVNGGDGGVYITNDITASPIVWTELGNATEPPSNQLSDVQVSMNAGTPTFYVKAGGGTRTGGGSLWRFDGTNPASAWTRVDNNDGVTGGFNVFAADPNDPNRLYAGNMSAAGPRMLFSNDGGATWDPDTELDTLMRGDGAFLMRTNRGATNFTGFNGYPQPSLLAFDPGNPQVIVAGGVDSGVFLSWNGGADWGLVTDPVSSHTSGIPHIPRPYYSYFDNTNADTGVFIGTQGRGVWRIEVTLPIADAGGPYETDEGVDVALDGTGSTDPGGGALDYAWDFDNDGDFDDATGPTPLFDRVGQDGVFTVRLKVSAGGAFDIDETTVTVLNVAPSLSLASDAPVAEGSPVTVSGTVTDPGWLDPLTATIDWADGAFENIAGSLENIRPDATLTFSVSHVYGDNFTFTAEVCGFDDDTSVCEPIELPIDNVVPTAEIDESDAVLLNGTPTIVAEAGEPVEFSGRTTDPGSDDLSVTWTWDDGTPNDVELYLVNPPALDPLPSPSVQPRDVTDTRDHTFAEACLYLVQFDVTDDDAGVSPGDEVSVVIVGNAEDTRSAGFWRHQYRGRGFIHFDEATLECYLAITRHVSAVFDEIIPLTTFAQAEAVLNEAHNAGSAQRHLDRQLLAAWLNFANGGVGLFELVDIDGDNLPDATFLDVIVEAEAVRLDPTSTNAELEAQKDALETINVRAG